MCAFMISDLKQEGRDTMNIYWEYEDIFGRAETTHLNRTMEEFMMLANSIRRKLGSKSYLLDQYISMLLEGAEAARLFTAAERGFGAMSELRQMCSRAMEGKNDPEEHPLFETVREYIHSHPLDCQDDYTQRAFYWAALSGKFTEYVAKQYWYTLKEAQRVRYDIVALRDLYRQVSMMLGDENEMERLNLLFRQRFLFVPAMLGFLQGVTNDLTQTLIVRDPETGKLIFQLWLDKEMKEA